VEEFVSTVATPDLEKRIDLKIAEKIACELVDLIKQHLIKYEVCGSIRRRKPQVGDIDIVAIPKTNYTLGEETLSDFIKKIDPKGIAEAKRLGKAGAKRFLDGDLIKRFEFKEMSVDLYLADEQTFGTLVLIRTGSKEHNIKLTTIARAKGLKLFASGKGLCEVDKDGKITKIIGTEEKEILAILLDKIPDPAERQ